MKEILNTLLTSADDRIKNPLIGSFVFSWIAFNWKPIAYLFFSEEKIKSRFMVIETDYSNVYNLFWIPLGIALFYSLLFPYINLVLNRLISSSKRENRKDLHKIEIDKLDQSIELELKRLEKEEAKADLIKTSNENSIIDELKKELDDNQSRIEALVKDKSKLSNDLRISLTNLDEVERTNLHNINELKKENALKFSKEKEALIKDYTDTQDFDHSEFNKEIKYLRKEFEQKIRTKDEIIEFYKNKYE